MPHVHRCLTVLSTSHVAEKTKKYTYYLLSPPPHPSIFSPKLTILFLPSCLSKLWPISLSNTFFQRKKKNTWQGNKMGRLLHLHYFSYFCLSLSPMLFLHLFLHRSMSYLLLSLAALYLSFTSLRPHTHL